MLKVFQIFSFPLATEGHTNSIFTVLPLRMRICIFMNIGLGENPLADYVQSSTVIDLMPYDLFHNCL